MVRESADLNQQAIAREDDARVTRDITHAQPKALAASKRQNAKTFYIERGYLLLLPHYIHPPPHPSTPSSGAIGTRLSVQHYIQQ